MNRRLPGPDLTPDQRSPVALSVVLPAFNEADLLHSAVTGLARGLRACHEPFAISPSSEAINLLRHGFALGISDTHGVKVLRADVLRPSIMQCALSADRFDTELICAGRTTVKWRWSRVARR